MARPKGLEHPTEEGKLYCAAVMDAYGRRIIGYSMADHLRTELVLDALSMAITRRPPARHQTILHSDHGAIYVLGFRAAAPEIGSARIDGHGR